MKRSYISIIVLVLALSVSAQAPLSFKYQAYLRNADGTIRGNEFVTLQLRIRQGSANGTAVYTEVHNTSTNGHGLVSVDVGDGSTSSNMSSVQWGNGPYFLNITVNGINLGTTELLSVPFALYANETGDSFSGAYSDLTGTPNLARVATTGNYSDLTNTPHLSTVAITGSYASLLNIPLTFVPSVHAHLEAEISDLAHYTDADIDGTEAAFVGWDMDVSDDFVGDMGGFAITNVADPVNPQDAATRAYVDASASFSGSFNDLTDVPVTLDRDSTDNLPVSFNDLTDVPVNLDIDVTDDFTGDMGGLAITNVADPVNPQDAATRAYVDASASFSGSFNDLTDVPVNLDIDVTDDFTGDMIGARIINLGPPTAPTDAATRAYVDASSGSFSGSYNDLSDVPALAPAVHAHVEADITNLAHYTDADIDGAETAFNNWDKNAADDFNGNYSSLTGAPAQIGDLGGNMSGATITNLGTPAAGTDAVNRAYVDALEARIAVLEGLVGTLITDLDALEAVVTALTARVTAHELAYP